MHFDLAHAAVAAVLIFIAVWAVEKIRSESGREKREKKWDWQIFLVVFAVMLILNLVWPYQ